MKPPRPDLYNQRVIYLAGRFISMPFRVVANVYRWVREYLLGPHSAQAVREKDQARQSRVRRELRGLPADHDAGRTTGP